MTSIHLSQLLFQVDCWWVKTQAHCNVVKARSSSRSWADQRSFILRFFCSQKFGRIDNVQRENLLDSKTCSSAFAFLSIWKWKTRTRIWPKVRDLWSWKMTLKQSSWLWIIFCAVSVVYFEGIQHSLKGKIERWLKRS